MNEKSIFYKTLKPLLIFVIIYVIGYLFKLIPSMCLFYGQSSIVDLVLVIIAMIYFSKGKIKIYGFKKAKFKTILYALLVTFIYELICSYIQNKYIRISRGGNMEAIPIYLLVLINIVIAPIAEELLTRGYLQTSLAHLKHIGIKIFNIYINIPILISSLVFALAHIGLLAIGVNYLYVIYTVIFAFFLGLISACFKEKTGSIYPSVLIHSFANFLNPFFLFVFTRYALFLIR